MTNERTYSADVVVTAGGTHELIDDVRYIGNFSTGKFGYELAKAYSQLGFKVLLLAPQFVIDHFGELPSVTHIPFVSAADLEAALHSITEAKLVLHSAAVSDYTPVRVNGKISSDKDELVITLKRTPKIISGLREHFGNETKIVGFKLLSGVPETKLFLAALKQIRANDTDMCVANDLQEIKEVRKVHIVEPNGRMTTIVETPEELAKKLALIIQVESARRLVPSFEF